MYHYKALIYSPTLGCILQTDPIGYEDQANLYAYVGNDPVDFSDPTGSEMVCTIGPYGKTKTCEIVVRAHPVFVAAAVVLTESWNIGYSEYRGVRDFVLKNESNDSGNSDVDVTDPASVVGESEEDIEKAAEQKGMERTAGENRRRQG